MNDIRKSQMVMAKELRKDAKKLETVAKKLETITKHLRQQAKDIANPVRANKRAEEQRSNFFSNHAPLAPVFKNDLVEMSEEEKIRRAREIVGNYFDRQVSIAEKRLGLVKKE